MDLHPVGPLDADELSVTRILGAPEVASFPTALDRSLRLSGDGSGICLEPSETSPAAEAPMVFDLHIGEAGPVGRLLFSLGTAGTVPAISLALDLVTLAELDREGWYQVSVTRQGDAGRLEVTPLGDGRPVLEAVLDVDTRIEPASPDEFCIQSSLPSSEFSVFVDNLQFIR